ncbi:NAD-dependent epimerase/dehydratase family protein [Pelosinus propionicus]|uniref:UDP-glucose 4-epimerase n=1 Tax=Pelosinus propionicus DSM 13327 TaxID=1123291 RepID=A0A1I4HUB7_9FIRM|nr:NAD-dependent epimerase/dehydratase family protein [Pelosinus propionicus]SFL45363.1 UDP-glucose 4-epimerase [Pelosinus propionicus DSM 13327]
MRCLVLGGDGFIGSYIVEQLLIQKHQVTVYKRPNTLPKNLNHIKDNINFIYGDFRTENDFTSLLSDIDWVFHVICTTLPANENAISDIEENVIPTLRLLEACREVDVQKIIFVSSGGTVYGPSDEIGMSEDHLTNPICAYGVQKLMIEKYLNLFQHLYGVDYAVMRVANPYGERQNPLKPQGAIAAFIARAILGQRIEIWGDGSVVRDFLHVSDVAKAAVKIAEYMGQEKVFNIGSGLGYSLNEVIDCIESVIGEKVNKNFRLERKQDVPFNVLDISKTETYLGWKPEVTIEDGIERVVREWIVKFR